MSYKVFITIHLYSFKQFHLKINQKHKLFLKILFYKKICFFLIYSILLTQNVSFLLFIEQKINVSSFYSLLRFYLNSNELQDT